MPAFWVKLFIGQSDETSQTSRPPKSHNCNHSFNFLSGLHGQYGQRRSADRNTEVKTKFYELLKHSPKGMVDPKGTVPFVFSLTEGRVRADIPEDNGGAVLACPYPKFSIEMEGEGMVMVADPGDPKQIAISCVHCTEIGPDDYELIILGHYIVESNPYARVVKLTKAGGKIENAYHSIIPVVNDFLNRLNTGKAGTVKVTGHQKYRSHGKRLDYHPNEIIYIGASGSRKQPEKTVTGEPIDWSSAWNVRAHWRRLNNPESVGIGRNGLRDVVGFTWISNYKKGEGELCVKPYKVL